MRVTHRLMAACVKVRQFIEATFFDGSPEESLRRAVEADVSHGLPLSLADRRAAVERIVSTRSVLSDRAVARLAGVGANTVAAIRKCSTATGEQLNGLVGRDGRVRPVSGTAGRLQEAGLFTERPDASAREPAGIPGGG
jgi:hypothetical protein